MFAVIINPGQLVFGNTSEELKLNSTSTTTRRRMIRRHSSLPPPHRFRSKIKRKYTTRTRAWRRNTYMRIRQEMLAIYIALRVRQYIYKGITHHSKLIGHKLICEQLTVCSNWSLYAYKDSWPLSWKDLVGHCDEAAAKIQWFVRKRWFETRTKC